MSKMDYLDDAKGFDPRNVYGLPELCYVYIPGAEIAQHIGIVKRGETGYYPSPGMTLAAADEKNRVMGITDAQRDAMQAGSMWGWDRAITNPAKWTKARPICADTRAVEREHQAITARANKT